ncbi:MAG: hypothetical protein LBK52_05885 [Deltaproteobacteria bacterium]|jgi:hypothetical protein|nr:hypothetical protein [Deltaproteobacteria bacterium]
MRDQDHGGRPGGDETFDIEIEGFDSINFSEDPSGQADLTPEFPGQDIDQELERIIRRLDEVTAPQDPEAGPVPDPPRPAPRRTRPGEAYDQDSGQPYVLDSPAAEPLRPAPPVRLRPPVPAAADPPVLAAEDPRPPVRQAVPASIPRPPARPAAIPRPPAEPAPSGPRLRAPADPYGDRETILLTERLAEAPGPEVFPAASGTSGADTVAQMTPGQLAELIERAVERGMARALAASRNRS